MRATVIPGLDVLFERWRGGESVTSVAASTGYSRWVLSERFWEAMDAIGTERALRVLSEATEPLDSFAIRDAINEKRCPRTEYILIALVRDGLVAKRWRGQGPDPTRFGHWVYRLTPKGRYHVNATARTKGKVEK